MKKNRSSPSEPLIPYQHTLLECNFGCRVLIGGIENQNLHIIQVFIVFLYFPIDFIFGSLKVSLDTGSNWLSTEGLTVLATG